MEIYNINICEYIIYAPLEDFITRSTSWWGNSEVSKGFAAEWFYQNFEFYYTVFVISFLLYNCFVTAILKNVRDTAADLWAGTVLENCSKFGKLTDDRYTLLLHYNTFLILFCNVLGFMPFGIALTAVVLIMMVVYVTTLTVVMFEAGKVSTRRVKTFRTWAKFKDSPDFFGVNNSIDFTYFRGRRKWHGLNYSEFWVARWVVNVFFIIFSEFTGIFRETLPKLLFLSSCFLRTSSVILRVFANVFAGHMLIVFIWLSLWSLCTAVIDYDHFIIFSSIKAKLMDCVNIFNDVIIHIFRFFTSEVFFWYDNFNIQIFCNNIIFNMSQLCNLGPDYIFKDPMVSYGHFLVMYYVSTSVLNSINIYAFSYGDGYGLLGSLSDLLNCEYFTYRGWFSYTFYSAFYSTFYDISLPYIPQAPGVPYVPAPSVPTVVSSYGYSSAPYSDIVQQFSFGGHIYLSGFFFLLSFCTSYMFKSIVLYIVLYFKNLKSFLSQGSLAYKTTSWKDEFFKLEKTFERWKLEHIREVNVDEPNSYTERFIEYIKINMYAPLVAASAEESIKLERGISSFLYKLYEYYSMFIGKVTAFLCWLDAVVTSLRVFMINPSYESKRWLDFFQLKVLVWIGDFQLICRIAWGLLLIKLTWEYAVSRFREAIDPYIYAFCDSIIFSLYERWFAFVPFMYKAKLFIHKKLVITLKNILIWLGRGLFKHWFTILKSPLIIIRAIFKYKIPAYVFKLFKHARKAVLLHLGDVVGGTSFKTYLKQLNKGGLRVPALEFRFRFHRLRNLYLLLNKSPSVYKTILCISVSSVNSFIRELLPSDLTRKWDWSLFDEMLASSLEKLCIKFKSIFGGFVVGLIAYFEPMVSLRVEVVKHLNSYYKSLGSFRPEYIYFFADAYSLGFTLYLEDKFHFVFSSKYKYIRGFDRKNYFINWREESIETSKRAITIFSNNQLMTDILNNRFITGLLNHHFICKVLSKCKCNLTKHQFIVVLVNNFRDVVMYGGLLSLFLELIRCGRLKLRNLISSYSWKYLIRLKKFTGCYWGYHMYRPYTRFRRVKRLCKILHGALKTYINFNNILDFFNFKSVLVYFITYFSVLLNAVHLRKNSWTVITKGPTYFPVKSEWGIFCFLSNPFIALSLINRRFVFTLLFNLLFTLIYLIIGFVIEFLIALVYILKGVYTVILTNCCLYFKHVSADIWDEVMYWEASARFSEWFLWFCLLLVYACIGFYSLNCLEVVSSLYKSIALVLFSLVKFAYEHFVEYLAYFSSLFLSYTLYWLFIITFFLLYFLKYILLILVTPAGLLLIIFELIIACVQAYIFLIMVSLLLERWAR